MFKRKRNGAKYSEIYNAQVRNIKDGTECICCHNKHSVEHGDGCYFCNVCHMIFSPETYEAWFNGETIEFDYENGSYFFDPNKYAIVYDEDGEEVTADCCGVPIMWDEENYVCPECGRIFSRADFFERIGANIPGELCITCDQLWPCTFCHRGYDIPDEF